MESLMQFKENQFEILKSTTDKAVVMGRLEMLKDLAIYIDNMRESYTRLLVVNGMDEDEYKERLDGSYKEKDRHKGVKGLDPNATGEVKIYEQEKQPIEMQPIRPTTNLGLVNEVTEDKVNEITEKII
tara:strand:- start:6708 stop:7091 length:384 start_codon:yes stop_codon:yes gene_type:complete